ncbi:MAG: helix-turn-helix domain-containing protein [Chitinophagaceae bacterium]
MAVEIITKEDLQTFRFQLLDDLKNILHTNPQKQKQWLKSSEVRKLLKISPGTLQNLRINGTLSFTKIGSIIYYNYEDIEALLDNNNKANLKTTNH